MDQMIISRSQRSKNYLHAEEFSANRMIIYGSKIRCRAKYYRRIEEVFPDRCSWFSSAPSHWSLVLGTTPKPPNRNLKNIIFEVIIRHHKLCFQSMLKISSGWSLIKELSKSVSKSTKNVKMNYFVAIFHWFVFPQIF